MRRALALAGLLAGCDPFEATPAVAVPAAAEAGAGVVPDAGGAPELPRCLAGTPIEEGFDSGVFPPAGWTLDPAPAPDVTASSDAPISGARSVLVLLGPRRTSAFGTKLTRRLQGSCVDVELALAAPRERTPDGLTFFVLSFPNQDQVIGYTSIAGRPRRWVFGEQNASLGEYGGLFEGALPESGPVRLRVRISDGTADDRGRRVSVWADGALVGTMPTSHALAGDAKIELGVVYAAAEVTGEVRLDDVRIR